MRMNRSSSAVAFAAATKRAEGSSTAAEVSAVMSLRRLCRGATKLELHWGPEVMSEGSVTGGTGRHPILLEEVQIVLIIERSESSKSEGRFGHKLPPTFATATEELASIPDANDANRRHAASCRSYR
jgi:hypothetical protein